VVGGCGGGGRRVMLRRVVGCGVCRGIGRSVVLKMTRVGDRGFSADRGVGKGEKRDGLDAEKGGGGPGQLCSALVDGVAERLERGMHEGKAGTNPCGRARATSRFSQEKKYI